jgi:hypothetical protein
MRAASHLRDDAQKKWSLHLATANTLIDDVAQISGMPRPTIKGYVVGLREAGLIHTTCRGANAAAMAYQDAAALLAATLVRPTIAEAAEATKAALNLPLIDPPYFFDPFALACVKVHLEKISKRDDGSHVKTFGDALRRLLFRAVESRAKDEPERVVAEKYDKPIGWGTLFAAGGEKRKVEIYFCQTTRYPPVYFAFMKLKYTPTAHLCLEYGSARRLGELEEPYSPCFTLYEEGGHQDVTAKIIGVPTLLAYARSVVKPIF